MRSENTRVHYGILKLKMEIANLSRLVEHDPLSIGHG